MPNKKQQEEQASEKVTPQSREKTPEKATNTAKTSKASAAKKSAASGEAGKTQGSAKKSTASSAKKSTTAGAKKRTATGAKKSTTAKKSTAGTSKSTAVRAAKEKAKQAEEQIVTATPNEEPPAPMHSAQPDAAPASPAQPDTAPASPMQQEVARPTPLLEAPASNLPSVGGHGGAVKTAVPPVKFPELVRERRSFFGMFLMFFVIAAVLVASILIFLYRPTAYAERTNSVLFFYRAESDSTIITVNGAQVGESYAGKCTAHAYDNTGDTSAALIGGTLYLIDGREVTALCAEVADFVISQNGQALAYRTAENKLYYCTLGREITTSLMSGDTRDPRYCLSPNGKELFYTYVREEHTRIELYSTTNNKPQFAKVTDFIPVAVANNCAFVYYADANDGTLYYYKNGADAPVICYKGEEPYTLAFNRDFSELLLYTANGTQLYRDGKQTVIPALKAGERLEFLANKRAETRELPTAYQYLVKTFEKGYYLKSGNAEDGTMLMYLDSKGNLSLVHYVREDVSKPVVTDKGVYFLAVQTRSDVETLMHLRCCEIGETESELLYQDVLEFCVNTDGSRVMYTDQQGALLTMRKGEVPTRLADQINQSTLCVTSDDAFYYYVGDSLYISDNGEAPRLARSDASALFLDAHTAYFVVPEGEGETFTVYSNHRNRRRDTLIGNGIAEVFG